VHGLPSNGFTLSSHARPLFWETTRTKRYIRAPSRTSKPPSNYQLSRLGLHNHTNHHHHYHRISHTRSTCPRHLSNLTSAPTTPSWTIPRARSPHHHRLRSTRKECPRRTSTIPRSHSRFRAHSPRVHSRLRCHSIRLRRWPRLTRRHPYHLHLRVRALGVSLSSTGGTGPQLPSWRI
jgi:hypothetical protein